MQSRLLLLTISFVTLPIAMPLRQQIDQSAGEVQRQMIGPIDFDFEAGHVMQVSIAAQMKF